MNSEMVKHVYCKFFNIIKEIMETIVRSATRGQHAKLVPEVSGKTRYWRSQDGMHNIGRFIPDLNPRTKEGIQ